MTAYEHFQNYIAQINDLCCVLNVLNWDNSTQMPPGGAEMRGFQLGTVARIAQERFTAPEMEQLIEAAWHEVEGEDPDSYHLRNVREAREAYQIVKRIPADLIAEMTAARTVSQQVWQEAKSTSNFKQFAPYLEKMVSYQRRTAEAIGYETHPYDALLRRYEPGMTAARLKVLFAELKEGLTPILRRAQASPEPRHDFLERDYPEDKQRAFALEIVQAFGYDLKRGRVDISAHPFEISFTRQDVRITTRYKRNFLPGALFGLFHESGHAMYEQGADPAITRSALTTDLLGLYAVAGVSYGAHESQSRLWENPVSRSRAFWQHHFPRLQFYFPEQLADVDAETFYRAVNRVACTPIRVEADEVTYNFHIMLRVEVEMGMLDGSLAVKDLPEFWNAKMQEYLGITPSDDAHGALQDIHWAAGDYGSFPCYTIGNVMSGQFFAAAREQVAGLDEALTHGNYAPLHGWLSENIYRHGRAFSPDELLQRSTGSHLNAKPYLDYLTKKFAELFPG